METDLLDRVQLRRRKHTLPLTEPGVDAEEFGDNLTDGEDLVMHSQTQMLSTPEAEAGLTEPIVTAVSS